VAVAPGGAIYVSDTNNNRIRVIQNGTVSALAGGLAGADALGFANGQGTAARFAQPMGIALEANGNLLVADSWNMRIREVTPQGAVTTWVGSGALGIGNGAGSSASLQFPMAIAVTPGGDALFVEPDLGWLRKVTFALPHSTSQVAGQLFVEGWEDGPVSSATMYHSVALAVRRSDGQVLLVDGASARVRAIRNGVVDTLAGGMRGGTVDGSGDQAGFASPSGVAIAADGSAYVVDAKEATLRRITGF
jgi:DNA-binding beta-propeller fold protein YncE